MNIKLAAAALLIFSIQSITAQKMELIIPEGHVNNIEKLKFSKDGNFLISAADESVKIWNAKNGALINTFSGNIFELNADESIIVVTGGQRSFVYEMYTNTLITELPGGLNAKYVCGGKYLVITNEYYVYIYESIKYELIKTLDFGYDDTMSFNERHTNFEISPDGKFFISYCNFLTSYNSSGYTGHNDSDFLTIWSIESGALIKKVDFASRYNIFLKFSPDCKGVYLHTNYYKSLSDTLSLWSIDNGVKTKSVPIPKRTDINYTYLKREVFGDTIVYISNTSLIAYSLVTFKQVGRIHEDTTIENFFLSEDHLKIALITPEEAIRIKSLLHTDSVINTFLRPLPLKDYVNPIIGFDNKNGNIALANNNNVKVSSVRSGTGLYNIKGAGVIVKSNCLKNGNRLLLQYNNLIGVLDNSSGKVKPLTYHTLWKPNVYYSYDYRRESNTFLTKDSDSSFAIYNALNDSLLYHFRHPLKYIDQFDYSEDGKNFFLIGDGVAYTTDGAFRFKGSQKLVVYSFRNSGMYFSTFNLSDIRPDTLKNYDLRIDMFPDKPFHAGLTSENTFFLHLKASPKVSNSLQQARGKELSVVVGFEWDKNKFSNSYTMVDKYVWDPDFKKRIFCKNRFIYFTKDSLSKQYIEIFDAKTGKFIKNALLPKSCMIRILNDSMYFINENTITNALTNKIFSDFSSSNRQLLFNLKQVLNDLLVICPQYPRKNDTLTLLDKKGGIVNKFNIDNGYAFSISGKKLAISNRNGVSLYDFKNKKMTNLQTTDVFDGARLYFTPDEKYVITNSHIYYPNISPSYISIFSTLTGDFLKEIYSERFEISPNNLFMYCIDGSKITFYKYGSFDSIYSVIFSGSSTSSEAGVFDYFSLLPSLYYKAEPKTASQFAYKNKRDNSITIESNILEMKYNRPDIVLEELLRNFGNRNDSALVDAYRKAYIKRLRRTNTDTTSFYDQEVISVNITNRSDIKYEQHQDSLSIHVRGIGFHRLKRLNVNVNGIPIFGSAGINLLPYNKNVIDTVLDIRLSEGVNKIEVGLWNISGNQSGRLPLYVMYSPIMRQENKLHFIGIGINHFADNRNNLSWSVKDVRDLADSFKTRYGSSCIIDTLFDEKVTTEKVAALKNKLLQTGVNDKVIVAYSGHGMLSKDYDYYLSTYNINFSKPEEGGLPYVVLENLLDSIPARKKLMLIDACHSGEVDKEEMQQYERVQQQLDSTKKGVYVLINKNAKRLGTKNSFELMQELFVNVGRSTGATIISAAAGTQFALERNNLQNGVFTYSILEYMKNHPHVSINELKKYVNQRVPELTQGAQVPTARSETNSVDWEVW